MNIRLKSTLILLAFYVFLATFGVAFTFCIEYFFNISVHVPMVIGTMFIVNTITDKDMRNHWKNLYFGDRTTYSDHRPGFTNEIMDAPTDKKGINDDLNDLLRAATKKKVNHSELKGNPLND